MRDEVGRVALLWRGERLKSDHAIQREHRLWPVSEALADLGVVAEAVAYSDDAVEEVRGQLLRCDGVLVWVDPISGRRDRITLDALLRDVSSAGVWVSAHPDTIVAMGTKDVLYRTRQLSWGTDTYLYATFGEFQAQFPARLALGEPRVLKQHRGNGGIGVWKVEIVTDTGDVVVRVQHAAPRDTVTEDMPIQTFLERCEAFFTGPGRLIDQAFATRIAEGMIRAYVVQDEVVGFARQAPAASSPDRDVAAPHGVFGLASAKTMYGPSEPEFRTLKRRLEEDWIPALCGLVGLDPAGLPLLWDADFLYGAPSDEGAETFILCEINVSAVAPFPQQVLGPFARAVLTRLVSPQ